MYYMTCDKYYTDRLPLYELAEALAGTEWRTENGDLIYGAQKISFYRDSDGLHMLFDDDGSDEVITYLQGAAYGIVRVETDVDYYYFDMSQADNGRLLIDDHILFAASGYGGV